MASLEQISQALLNADAAGDAESATALAQEYRRLSQAPEPEKPFFKIGDVASALGDVATNVIPSTWAGVRRGWEGIQKEHSPEYLAAMQADEDRNRAVLAENERRAASGDLSTAGENIREIVPSLGFMGASIPATLIGAKTGAFAGGRAATLAGQPEFAPQAATVGAIVGGGAAGFGTSYRMMGAQFMDDAMKHFNDLSLQKLNRPLNDEEKQKIYDDLLPVAQNTALWEAGPEAIGNLATLGAGKVILGIGKPAFKALVRGAQAKIAAGVGAQGTEHLTEGITEFAQGNDQQKLEAYKAGLPMDQAVPKYQGAEGLWEATKEVAPAVATLGALTAGAGGVAYVAKKALTSSQPAPIQEAVATAADSINQAAAEGVPVAATAQALNEIEQEDTTAADFAESLRRTQEEGDAADIQAAQMRAQEEYAAAQAAAERQAQFESLTPNEPLPTTTAGSPVLPTGAPEVANLEAANGANEGLGNLGGGLLPQESDQAIGSPSSESLAFTPEVIPTVEESLTVEAPRITELARQAAAINAGAERGSNLKFPRVAHEMDTMPLKDLSNYAKAQGMKEKESVGYARGHIAEWATKIVDKANGLFGKSIKLGFFPSKISKDGMRVVASGKGMSHKNGIEVDDSQSPLHAAWVALHEFAHQLFPTQALPREASLAKGLHPKGLEDIKSKTKAEKLASDFANWMLAKEYPEHAASIPTVSKPLADFFESNTKPITPTTETPTSIATEGQPMSGDSGSVVGVKPPKVGNVSAIPTPEEEARWAAVDAFTTPYVESLSDEALDTFGSIVGVRRNGVSDAPYRAKILGSTHPDDLLDAMPDPLSPAPTQETPLTPSGQVVSEKGSLGTSATAEVGGHGLTPVETKETSQAETSSGKVEAGNAALDEMLSELSPTIQAKWTPEVRVKASKFFESQDDKDLEGLNGTQKTKIREANYRVNEEAAAQEKAERKLYEKKLREEEKENARLEKERAEQEKLTESRRAAYDSIIGTPSGVEMNAVSPADGQESLALVHNSGDVPGVLNAFVGTSKEFLANPQNEKDFPELWKILKAGRVDEGNFAYGRAFVFTDGIGVNESDRRNAAKLGITPSVAAVRRVLIHESLVHRGIYGLPARLQMQILQWVRQNATPQQLDALASDYPQYADWATNPQQMLGLCEEFLAKNVEKMTKFPTSGPLARLVEILKDIWRWITGNDGEPTVQNIRDVVKLLKAGAKAADQRLVNGGGIKMSQILPQSNITHAQDAEYMAAVESGDVAKQQAMVDAAAKAAGYNVGPVYRGDRIGKTIFTGREDKSNYIQGNVFFSSEPAIAAGYAQNNRRWKQGYVSSKELTPADGLYRTLLRMGNPLVTDAKGEGWDAVPFKGGAIQIDDLAVEARDSGHDGLIVKNVTDQYGESDQYVVFDPNQIKSADPVTRDEQGNIIPLSQRFNQTPDIRYSRISYAASLNAQLASASERMRQMREKQVPQEVDAQTIRGEIRKAYDRAIIGDGSIQASLQKVFDEAKTQLPTLTERQFGEQVQALYEDGSAFLVPTDRSADMLAAGEKWGVYDVVGLPASYVGVMPSEVKASRVSSETEAQHRKLVQEKKISGKQVNYGGRPIQDKNGNILDPTYQTEEGNKLNDSIATKIVADLVKELPSATELADTLNNDGYLSSIGAERNLDLQHSLLFEAERVLREMASASKDPEEAHALNRAGENAGIYARQIRSGLGRGLGRVGWQYKDPKYAGQILVDGITQTKREEQAEAVAGKFSEDAETQVESINSDANKEATDAMAGDLEGALENQQLEEGKKSLSEKARGLLAKIHAWIADLGAVRMALASKKGNIKASSAAERRSKYDNMTVAQLEAEEATLSKKVEDALEELADELFKTASTKKGGKKVTKAGAKKTAEKLARPTAKEKLLKGGKMTQLQRLLDKTREGWTWAQIFTLPEAGQFRRRADMLQKVKENEAFADLTDDEKAQLVDLLDQAWYDRKAEYFGRILQKMGAKLPFASNKSVSLAVIQSVDKLLKHFNDGTFDRDAFREVLAEKFGIKPVNQENLAKAKKLAQEMQSPDISNPMWVKKADELIKLVSEGQKLSKARILSDWWITSVLSGPRTLFAIATAFSNGLGRIIADGGSNMILKGDVKSMGKALKRYFELWPQAFKEMGHYIVSGDKSILENSKEQLSGFMADGLKGGNPISTAYQLLHWNKDKHPDASPWEKTQGKIMRMMGRFMTVVERILTGLDHFNAATTKYGYLPLAIAQNRAIYENARLPTEAEMSLYRDQAKAELFDGKEPQTAAEKIVLDNWARQLSDKHYSEFQDIIDGANYAGQIAAMTTNPEGFAGGAYRLILGAASKGRDAADKLARQAELIKKDPDASKYDIWLAQTSAAAAQLAAYSAQNLLGLRFIRYLSNKFSDTLTYIPIAGALLRAGEKTNRNNTKKSIIQSNQAIGFTLGWLGWMAVKAIADEPDDEKRGWSIDGSWESLSPEQKSQLMSDGRKMYSITIYGKDGKKHVLSYQGWPISAILSAIGTLTDMVKYQRDKWDEKDYGDRLFAAAYVASTSVADTAALSQLSEIMGKSVHSSDPIESGVKRFSRYGSNFAGGFIPRLFKDMDSWFNEGINKYDGVYENFAKEIPWYRTAVGKPRLDIFGEQVKVSRMPWSREFPRQPTDPAYSLLGKLNQRDLWLSPSDPALRTIGTGKRRRHLNPEEQDRYMREVSQGYKAIVEKYGQRILAMPGVRAEDFLADKAKEVRDRAEKKAIRRLQ